MTEPNDFHTTIVEEFRANGGKVGMFPNGSLLLPHSAGAKQTGRPIPAVILEPVR